MTDATAAAAEDQDNADDTAADLWAEFDEADGTLPGAEAAAAAAATFDADADADADAGGEAEGGAAEVEGTPAEPEPEAGAAAAEPDVWASAPENLRTEYAKLAADKAQLEHEVRSHKGRAVSAQRRYDELLKAAQPRAVEGDRPSAVADLAAIKEDYPEIAAPLEKALGVIEGRVATLADAEEGRRTAAQAELSDFIQTEVRSLETQHPDYLDVLQKNSDKLVAWIDDQPRAVRDAFARNATDIVDAAEAAKVIGMFKDYLGTPAPAPAAEARTAATATDPLASRRERQLGATASLTRSNRRPTVSGIPEDGDPQDIWDAFEAAEQPRR